MCSLQVSGHLSPCSRRQCAGCCAGVYSVWHGFDTNPNGVGFMAMYMTRVRTISTSDDCNYRSGTDYHYCGIQGDPNLQLSAWSGFLPHDTGSCSFANYCGLAVLR